jgi:hypothetical protein
MVEDIGKKEYWEGRIGRGYWEEEERKNRKNRRREKEEKSIV